MLLDGLIRAIISLDSERTDLLHSRQLSCNWKPLLGLRKSIIPLVGVRLLHRVLSLALESEWVEEMLWAPAGRGVGRSVNAR